MEPHPQQQQPSAPTTSSVAPIPGQNTKSPSSLRAITNSRRRRVAPENRKRVATACNSCSIRRIKCSGERPCVQCTRSSRQCEYPEGVDKVTVPRSDLEALQAKCADLERRLRESPSSQSAPEPLSGILAPLQDAPVTTSSLPPPSTLAAPAELLPRARQSLTEEVTPTEGRLLSDPDGTARYFGESSGANFLNHVKEFMMTIQPLVTEREGPSYQPGRTFLASVGSYQTYDSRPLHVQHVDPLWLPSRTSMTVLLAELKYFAQDGNGDFPSGGIYYWGDLPALTPDPTQAPDLRHSGHLALLHIAFAVAVRLGATAEWRDECPSEAFFSRARIILGNPLDITSYSPREISVLLLMALYFIEMNRRDAAYMTVSMALHLAVMYGAHTKFGQDEGSKRIFWTLYILDCWLTCLLGRPPSLSEDAIRLDLPEFSAALPSPYGLRAHIELCRISRYIICNVYRIAPWDQSSNTTLQHVEYAMERLTSWLNSLPPELSLDYDKPVRDRACCSLHLSYNQHIILTARPIFFVVVKKTVADRYLPGHNKPSEPQDSFQVAMVHKCIDTARRNLALGRWVREVSPRARLLHQEAHCIFNAAVIVLLHQLAFADSELPKDANDVRFAVEVFEQEATLGNNFGIDCAKVLQDLRSLVCALREQGSRQVMVPMGGQQVPYDLNHVPMGGFVDMQLAMGENMALQRELQVWLDNDDPLQLYNDYMI